jgi:hypothetical protein
MRRVYIAYAIIIVSLTGCLFFGTQLFKYKQILITHELLDQFAAEAREQEMNTDEIIIHCSNSPKQRWIWEVRCEVQPITLIKTDGSWEIYHILRGERRHIFGGKWVWTGQESATWEDTNREVPTQN